MTSATVPLRKECLRRNPGWRILSAPWELLGSFGTLEFMAFTHLIPTRAPFRSDPSTLVATIFLGLVALALVAYAIL